MSATLGDTSWVKLTTELQPGSYKIFSLAKSQSWSRVNKNAVRKQNINILLMVAARNGLEIKSDDVTSAFLQSVPIDREMFINIPSERKIPGVMYGKLISQSLGRWMQSDKNISQNFVDLGCEKSAEDPAMYMHFDDIDGEESKEPIGITVTHVDDVLSVESTEFE